MIRGGTWFEASIPLCPPSIRPLDLLEEFSSDAGLFFSYRRPEPKEQSKPRTLLWPANTQMGHCVFEGGLSCEHSLYPYESLNSTAVLYTESNFRALGTPLGYSGF